MNGIIQIDTLELEDMTAEEGARTARSFEAELEALLAAYGMPEGASRADIRTIDLGGLPRQTQSPEAVGRELARALYAELSP